MKSKAFKDYYNSSYAKDLAQKLSIAFPKTDFGDFAQSTTKQIRGKEFLARQDIFARALEQWLPATYTTNLAALKKILGSELQQPEGMFTHGWWLWPIGRYVERNALHDARASLDFIYELTKRFTGEFAVRPLLREEPRQTLRVMLRWSKDPNVHVRRLASEGIRVKLPWAKKLDTFLLYPKECSKLLWNLREDPEKFVQKSVGNNLNDLFKVDRELAEDIIRTWKDKGAGNPHTEWIIRHGTRRLDC